LARWLYLDVRRRTVPDGIDNDREPGIDFDGDVSIWRSMIDDPDPECMDMP
jgi:hypothetical protein